MYKYEKAHEDRSTILDAIDFDWWLSRSRPKTRLTVEEISGRLDGLSPQELKALRRYEADTKARSIFEKIDTLLA